MPPKRSVKRPLPIDDDEGSDSGELEIERKSKKLTARAKEDKYVILHILLLLTALLGISPIKNYS